MNIKALAESYIRSLESRDWQDVTDLLSPDVVYEMPQSRERITGRDKYLQFNKEYPGDWHLAINRVVADDRHAVIWVNARVGDEPQVANVWLDINDDGQIIRVTDFWPETYEPPANRKHLVERY
ncbi:nuclear transport factor 2 family protein [Stackebrandtia nassauensis]|uniref:SnoaL-like domain-containing protein n=1 Tax=Stackebrandtia nassauensis (strain DSM 44728 / CIP 108903 / NRRL B-16338 / NBRC 102104 / LLR-40K-21) TaxID=446470 RepID=D3Q0Y6_STANL|nr:nuclear transport factor 2 family protein [Stackebrandtia nassauensis]ADD43736.1 conserved hypothetical protein [Stackebrandtia nassauensis DSM 44728]